MYARPLDPTKERRLGARSGTGAQRATPTRPGPFFLVSLPNVAVFGSSARGTAKLHYAMHSPESRALSNSACLFDRELEET